MRNETSLLNQGTAVRPEAFIHAGEIHYFRSGAAAGILATLAFNVIHHIFISNIWSFTIMMVIAGALCGACVGWSYGLLHARPTVATWLKYNLLHVAMLMLLGVASILIFDPVMSMAALMTLDGPPDDLIRQAMPMTLLFTLAAAAIVSQFYRRSWRHFGAILLTTTLLVLLLGLNVSVLGLVSIPGSSLYLVAKFLGLILAINLIFLAFFVALEWQEITDSNRAELSSSLKADIK